MKTITLSRKELYDLVWYEPVSSIIKKYFLTDQEFRKICVKMNVPLPKSGHWQVVKAGKPISVIPLPEEYNGETDVKLLEREKGEECLVALSPLEALQKEIEKEHSLSLIVPSKLTNPDKLVLIAKDILTDKNANLIRFYGMVFSSDNSLDMRIAPRNVGRALLFMDTFIKLIKARGHKIEIKNEHTYVKIGDEEIQIALREKTRRGTVIRGNWEMNEYIPIGVLSFQIGKFSFSKIEIMDGKCLIEDQLSKILAKLEIEGKREYEERLSRNRYWEEHEEKERKRQEFEKKKENELSNFKDLFHKAKRWHKANIVRKYIDEVETKAKEKDYLSEDIQSWLIWARKKVDWYDPFLEIEDVLLKGVDKDNLTMKKRSGWDMN